MWIWELIGAAIVGLMFCLTPIPLVPVFFVKAVPTLYAKYGKSYKTALLFVLFLIGNVGFAAFPALIA